MAQPQFDQVLRHPDGQTGGYRITSCLPTIQPKSCQRVHHPEVTPARGAPRSGQMGHALFIAESFSGWDADGVACWQQAGEECAESEERGGCEETTRGKGALHPVGEDGAEKAVNGNTD